MSEMIERVTKAIETALQQHGDADIRAGLVFLDISKVARAAIEAMREPTDAMDEEGAIFSDCNAATPTWQAMIDAALK